MTRSICYHVFCRHHDTSANGFSVIAVLVLLAAIASMALISGQAALDHRTLASRYLERIQAQHAALSGIEAGRYLLLADQTPWDGPGDPWFDGLTFHLNDTSVSVTIADEQSAIAIHHLMLPSGEPNPALMNALAKLFSDIPDIGKHWQSRMQMRRETHGFTTLSRAEMTHFLLEKTTNRVTAKHSGNPASTASDIKNRVDHSLTPFGTGRINLNTASPAVLEALGGPDLQRSVIAQRTTEPLQSVFQLPDAVERLQGLTHVVDVRSDFFTVSATASGRFVTGHAEAVLWRQNADLIVLRHKEWWSE